MDFIELFDKNLSNESEMFLLENLDEMIIFCKIQAS